MKTQDEIRLLELYEARRISRGYLRYMLKCNRQELRDEIERIEFSRRCHRFGGALALNAATQRALRSFDEAVVELDSAALTMANAFTDSVIPATGALLAEIAALMTPPSRWKRLKMRLRWLLAKSHTCDFDVIEHE